MHVVYSITLHYITDIITHVVFIYMLLMFWFVELS
jgi:hypothetical protein